ncbi:MAG: hypothetical protein HDR46_01060 [Bacteroides sp.]|nr:hypothetical protein [Bacteroides sp.]
MKQLLYLAAAFLVGYISSALLLQEHKPTKQAVETVTIYDTIPYYYPVARDSVVVRYETHRLPLADLGRDTIRDTVVVVDSVEVIVPITQKEYRDSTYHLWVSGYAPRLDSIYTFTRRDYTTITLPPIQPKRWHIVLSLGWSLTPKGVQPYFGAGVGYSIKSF